MSLCRLASLAARSLILAVGSLLLIGLGTTPSLEAAPRLKPSPILAVFGASTLCLQGKGEDYFISAFDRQSNANHLRGTLNITVDTGSVTVGFNSSAHYHYKPAQTGPVTMSVVANIPGYRPASMDFHLQVIDCKWTLNVKYVGIYPTVPRSIWVPVESLFGTIPLTLDDNGVVSGSGNLTFSTAVQGSAPGVFCVVGKEIYVTFPVQVSGNEVGRGLFLLSLTFATQSFSGGGLITCDVVGAKINAGSVPLVGDTSVVNLLGINSFNVSKTGGSAVPAPPERTKGIYWNTDKVHGQSLIVVKLILNSGSS